MPIAQINLAPDKDGLWKWDGVDADGEGVESQIGIETRTECIAAARAAGGAEEILVTRGDGEPETYFTPPTCRVVLLREDGSEVGELDPAPGEGDVGQRITLEPANATEEALTND